MISFNTKFRARSQSLVPTLKLDKLKIQKTILGTDLKLFMEPLLHFHLHSQSFIDLYSSGKQTEHWNTTSMMYFMKQQIQPIGLHEFRKIRFFQLKSNKHGNFFFTVLKGNHPNNATESKSSIRMIPDRSSIMKNSSECKN